MPNFAIAFSEIRLLLTLFVVVISQSLPLLSEEPIRNANWGSFRGENGVGTIPNCDVPLPWSSTDVAWEMPLPGKGHTSPVLWNEIAFVSSADIENGQQHLIAIELATGQVKWRKTYPSRTYPIHARNSFASSTPCVNEAAVFFSWASPDGLSLIALNHDGSQLWQRELGTYVSQHGFGCSPVLFGKTLVLVNSQDAQQLPAGVAPGQSRVMACDSQTGQLLWETPRTTTRVCYGTPTLFNDPSAGPALLLSNTGDGLSALSLETGEPLWNHKVFSKRCISSPQVVGELAIGTEGSGGGGNQLIAVTLSGQHEILFKIGRSAPYVPTPVALGELLFLWGDTGIVTCVKLPAGDVLWSKRIGGNVSSSPVIAGNKLIGIADDGTVTILAASAEFSELGSVKLNETCRATPALSKHFILLRTQSRLLCIGSPAAPQQ